MTDGLLASHLCDTGAGHASPDPAHQLCKRRASYINWTYLIFIMASHQGRSCLDRGCEHTCYTIARAWPMASRYCEEVLPQPGPSLGLPHSHQLLSGCIISSGARNDAVSVIEADDNGLLKSGAGSGTLAGAAIGRRD